MAVLLDSQPRQQPPRAPVALTLPSLSAAYLTGLSLLLLVACQHKTSPVSPDPVTPVQTDTLRAAGDAAARLVGTAVQSGLLGDGRYASTVGREFNYLTAEYEMKWSSQEASVGVNNFGPGDAIVGFGVSQGMRVKGHTLLWHGSVPGWVKNLSPTDLRAAVDAHIRTVAGHYRGQVYAWDVVNEAIADDGSGLRSTVFSQGLGASYIADAFRAAREADPQALLFYNDYGGEGLNAKSNRIYQLLSDLKAQGVPIDGVGLQMHISANARASDASIAANMRRLADLGLLVNISEMDVKINGVAGTATTKLEAQRTAYHDVVALCVAEPRCHAVTFCGFTDAHTWIDGDQPLLFDALYAAKPAYTGVLDALRRR